jgi:hypothetical protein
MDPILLTASEEPQPFWNLWGFQKDRPAILCQRIKEWDGWYETIDEEQFHIEKQQFQQEFRKQEVIEEPPVSARQTETVEQRRSITQRPRLFVYPNTEGPLGVFDLEDLDHASLCLLFKMVDEVL